MLQRSELTGEGKKWLAEKEKWAWPLSGFLSHIGFGGVGIWVVKSLGAIQELPAFGLTSGIRFN